MNSLDNNLLQNARTRRHNRYEKGKERKWRSRNLKRKKEVKRKNERKVNSLCQFSIRGEFNLVLNNALFETNNTSNIYLLIFTFVVFKLKI